MLCISWFDGAFGHYWVRSGHIRQFDCAEIVLALRHVCEVPWVLFNACLCCFGGMLEINNVVQICPFGVIAGSQPHPCVITNLCFAIIMCQKRFRAR